MTKFGHKRDRICKHANTSVSWVFLCVDHKSNRHLAILGEWDEIWPHLWSQFHHMCITWSNCSLRRKWNAIQIKPKITLGRLAFACLPGWFLIYDQVWQPCDHNSPSFGEKETRFMIINLRKQLYAMEIWWNEKLFKVVAFLQRNSGPLKIKSRQE